MSIPLKKIFFRRLNLLAILSTLFFGSLLIQAERLILLNDLRNKGESIARILATVTLDAVISHDYATVERYVADIVNDPAINAVTVTRTDQHILASSGHVTQKTSELVVSTSVSLGETTFGEVRISLSTERVRFISRILLLATIAIAFFFHVLGLLMSNLALKKAVILPLEQLKTAIKIVQGGEFNQQVTITNPSEFASIGDSFNDMSQTIKDNFEDIHRQQQRLQLEQNKLATIVNSMADGLFVTDNEGIIVSFNHSATNITGYSEEEAIGTKCSDLFQTSLCDDACAVKNEGQLIRNQETSMITKDKRLLHVAVSSAMLYDTEGKAVGGVQTFRDITADKKRQELYCRTEKLAAIGQLAAGVAHEINNPLSNILGYARTIVPHSAPEEIERQVSIIVEQTHKCAEIVKGLLNFSRSSGADPGLFAVNQLIERVIEMLGYQAKQRQATIHFAPTEEYSIYADPLKIEQVLFNMVSNGLQEIDANGNIWIDTGIAGTRVYITVADDGPGIPPELHQRIFEPFFTTKPVGEGTGLGLSICAGIIAEANGEIDVAKREGGGTIFTLLLPSAEQEKVLDR